MFHDTDGVSGAPGGKILSTWPLGPYGGYAIISGTSMATPFVAACYALVRSQNLGLSVQQGHVYGTSVSPVEFPGFINISMKCGAA